MRIKEKHKETCHFGLGRGVNFSFRDANGGLRDYKRLSNIIYLSNLSRLIKPK